MDAKQASEIFWKAYEDCSDGARFDYKNLKQSDLYEAGFEAVLSAVDKEWAERYLAMQESLKTVSWQLKEGYLSPTPLVTET